MKPRKPWVAGLLALLCPPLGPLYNGRVKFAYLVELLFLGLTALLNIIGVTFAGLMALCAVVSVAYIAIIAISARQAKNTPPSEPRWYQRWYVLLGALVVVSVCNSTMTDLTRRVRAFSIPAASMVPTLVPGDNMMARLHPGPLERGQLVVFRYPRDESIVFVKRVIGIPGDQVEMKSKKLFVNGQEVPQSPYTPTPDEQNLILQGVEKSLGDFEVFTEKLGSSEYHILLEKSAEFSTAFDKTTVPAGSYFVMGDNRDNSKDSRFWGMVPEANVIGVPIYLYFSRDFKRIGQSVH